MHLKRLELQGYKTFASRSEFAFESGITAIVGPNGSGKSNVADAIRWVLGEQSYRLLRGKKTEDMIFAGSQKRARAGMAQATIVLDNSDGVLPIDFSEVAIGRRGYRSGENEYLLNGNRVRLRDVIEILSSSGLGQRTYNVIGQGLIDAALSLRADERRALFEEAAGIALYKERREEALGKLDSTQRNLERVEDIISEIRPRMRRLERQAVRSREYAQIAADLENLLYLWYGHHWEQAKVQLREARSEAALQTSVLAAVRDEQASLEARLSDLRGEAQQLRAELGDWHRENSELHRQAENLQRNLAVRSERRRLLGQQQEELAAELLPLQQQRQEAADRLQKAQEDLDRSDQNRQEQRAAVHQIRQDLNRRRQQVGQLRDQEQQVQRDAVRVEARIANLQQQRETASREQQRLKAEKENTQEALAQQLASQATLQTDLTGQEGRIHELESQLAELEKAGRDLRQNRGQAAGHLETLRQEQQTARTRHTELAALRRTLHDLRTRGAGHQQVVQKLLADPRRPEGVAPVAQLLEVPGELEPAVAAAIGHELSALVVPDLATAEMVLTHPVVREARIKLLPLTEIKPDPLAEVPDDKDLIGLGARLASCDAGYRPVLQLLLGRIVIVRDRAAAQRLAPTLPPGSAAVALDGFLVAQDGRIVKPGADTGVGLLAQERQWRELPEQMAEADAALASADLALAVVQAQINKLDGQLDEVESYTRQMQQNRQQSDKAREKTALQLDRVTQNVAWHHQQLQDIERRAAVRAQELTDLQEHEQAAHQQQAKLREQRRQLQTQVAELPLTDLSRALSEGERALAQIEGARQNQQTLVDTQRRSLQQLEHQLAARQQRIEAIAGEREQLSADIAGERQDEQRLAEQIAVVSQQIAPAEDLLRQVEGRLEALRSEEETLKRRVRSVEQIENRAQLTLDRRETHLEHLRGRINDELGLVHLPLDEDIAGQTPLPLGEVVGQLPVVRDLPAGLEESIQNRKQQLKRMGPINPSAPAEYDELKERYSFLREQVQDLRETDAKLRQVIEELDVIMEREFKRTFHAVATEFKQAFTRLFGGGSARLILTDPDDPIQSGVEIIARPPGRRQQGLALLSGGERSLTAAALVFALLKISPTPFCVLDEVDAMLDEANVGRFRDMLTELSQLTQFIVITHNRGTIQAADTIYGVSLGDDGATQVISLRLEGEGLSQEE